MARWSSTGSWPGAPASVLSLNNDDTPRAGPGPTIPTLLRERALRVSLPEDGKFILIQPQSELDDRARRLACSTRYETASFRRYELAGVAHIPPDLNSLATIG